MPKKEQQKYKSRRNQKYALSSFYFSKLHGFLLAKLFRSKINDCLCG
jgi:hypothetical protein